ncbi:MAG: hypothetical protein HOP01_00750 [Gallionella sp.]|nr:hypothetical protein [Gallionella sp.]
MSKKIAYLFAAIAYGIFLIMYVKKPLLNLLADLPESIAHVLFFAGLVPVFILLGISASIKTAPKQEKNGGRVD